MKFDSTTAPHSFNRYERRRLETFHQVSWQNHNSISTTGIHVQRVKGKLFILKAKTNCCDMSYISKLTGMASQCQSGGVEDGQGWLPVHWAGRGGGISIRTIKKLRPERTLKQKEQISKFISPQVTCAWCGCVLGDWQYGDQVLALDKLCCTLFLLILMLSLLICFPRSLNQCTMCIL